MAATNGWAGAPSGRQRAVAERTERTIRRRRLRSSVMIGLMYVAAAVAILPLLLIVIHLIRLGGSSVRCDAITSIFVRPEKGSWPVTISNSMTVAA